MLDVTMAEPPRHSVDPNFHQSGKVGFRDWIVSCALIPSTSFTLGGGAKGPNRVTGGPELTSHANVFAAKPARPQSSQDRLIPAVAWLWTGSGERPRSPRPMGPPVAGRGAQ